MEPIGLSKRYRDRSGDIARKHGNTVIEVLREVYGRHFAPGCLGSARLADVLDQIDEPALTKLVHDVHGIDSD